MPKTPNDRWDAVKLSRGYISSYVPFTAVDGEGLRSALYVSGCLFACEGCFNKSTWSFRNGFQYTQELEDRIIRDLSNPAIQGMTFLGGEPFLNTPTLIKLAKRIRFELPSKDIWAWSGYTFEQIVDGSPDKKELLALVDVLIDGPFVEELKLTSTRSFLGSSNQRIVDVKESLHEGAVKLHLSGAHEVNRNSMISGRS